MSKAIDEEKNKYILPCGLVVEASDLDELRQVKQTHIVSCAECVNSHEGLNTDNTKVLVYWNGTCYPVYSMVKSRSDIRNVLSSYHIYYGKAIELFGDDEEMLKVMDDDAIDTLNRYESALVDLEQLSGGRFLLAGWLVGLYLFYYSTNSILYTDTNLIEIIFLLWGFY